jgi:hypothetical protein
MGVALLAPVPSLHLKSAVETCIEQGKVAFGSMSVDVFGKLEREFGFGIPVYIYASTHHGPPYDYAANGKISLRGILCNVEPATAQGKHPNPIYRPPSTFETEKRGLEVWWCFWEVSDLCDLPEKDRIPLTKFTALGQTKHLPFGFVPQGPMIVKAPFIA